MFFMIKYLLIIFIAAITAMYGENMTTITFVKGGETQQNLDAVWQGQGTNSKLTDKGIASAQVLAEKLKDFEFDGAYSDALLRTSQTAEEVLKFHPGIDLKVNADLTVRKITPFEKKTQAEVMQMYHAATQDPEVRNADEIFETADWIEGIESNDQLLQRMQNFIGEVDGKHRNVFATTHTDNIRLLLRWINHLDNKSDFKVHPHAILVIEIRDGKPFIKSQTGIDKR